MTEAHTNVVNVIKPMTEMKTVARSIQFKIFKTRPQGSGPLDRNPVP